MIIKIFASILLLSMTGCYMHTTHHITLDHKIKLDINTAPVNLTIKHKFMDNNLTETQKMTLAKQGALENFNLNEHDIKN